MTSGEPQRFPGRSAAVAMRSAVIVVIALNAACRAAPTVLIMPPVELLLAAGDDQYGTAGQTLQTKLHVVVRTLSTQLPRNDVEILWSVERGDATITGSPIAASDSTGSSKVSVRLGSATGEVVVRASVREQPAAQADFHLFTVDRPVVSGLSASSAMPGSSVTVTGANFSPNAPQNVVRFSGVRGTVTSASGTSLTVMLPSCLPEREVDVTVQLGAVASAPASLGIGPGGVSTSLAVGAVADGTDDGGLACHMVSGAGGASYLVLAQSTGQMGAAAYPYELTGLSSSPSPAAVATGPAWPELRQSAPADVGVAWDEHLREAEALMTKGRRPSAGQGAGPSRVAAGVPAVNQIRTFQVYRNPGDFTEVTATARYVGSRAALFVDVDAPGGGYTLADLEALSDQFDDVIYPTDTNAFGSESDLDDNERVVILFTPTVNALTARGTSGFIGGFFFGLDLLPEREGSNAGEVFYAIVPDPAGQYSDPRPKSGLLQLTPAILAHEFQHMINFNERVLKLGAEANEAVWLSEGLAQYAEELVARAYEERGDATNQELFRDGTRERSRRYLAHPEDVSLLISAGSGNLAERGAGFLYVAYLADRFGADLPGRLTRTTRTGVASVVAQTGTDWGDGLSDWWSALFVDGPDPEPGPRAYPSVDLAGFLGSPHPLNPTELGGGDFSRTGSLRSASVAYYIVTPPTDGTTTLRLGGDGGGASVPQAGMRMRIIRIQ